MNKNIPIFPANWLSSTRHTKKWKTPEIQINICPVCHYYSGRFSVDGVCQFCGYEVKRKAVCRTNEIKEVKKMYKKVTVYNHYGNVVFVFEEDKGKHREHCLCWSCGKFYPEPKDMAKNCPVASLLYNICVTLKLVTPVWECPTMVPPRPDQLDEVERK